MGLVALDGCDKNVLKPTHTTSNGELVFYEWIVEHFPASTVDTIMRKASLASNRDVPPVIGDDGTSYRPLIDEVVRRDLYMVPE